MFRNLLIALGLAAAAAAPAAAETKAAASRPATQAAALSAPDAVAEAFFAALRQGNLEAEAPRVFSILAAQKPAEVQNLVAQTNLVLKMYGKVRGWEMMRERTLSPSFVERFYLLRLDGPVFYRILFYKTDDGWTIYSLGFNDQFDKVGFPST